MKKNNINYYESVLEAIKNHMTEMITDLDLFVEYIQGFNDDFKKKNYSIKIQNIIVLLSNIFHIESFKNKNLYDTVLSEVLEQYVYIISTYNTIILDDIDKKQKLNNIYDLLLKIKNVIQIIEDFFLNDNLIDKYQIKDDENKLLQYSNDLKSIIGYKEKKKKFSFNIYPKVSFIGILSLLLFVFSLVFVSVKDFSYDLKASHEINQIDFDFQDKESYEKYKEEKNNILNKYNVIKSNDKSIKNFNIVKMVSGYIYLVYFIVGHIFFYIYRKKIDEDSGRSQYIVGHMRKDVALCFIFVNINVYRMHILESAKKGYDEALIELGILYLKGFFDNKNPQRNYEKALECFMSAFPNKKAIRKYNFYKKWV